MSKLIVKIEIQGDRGSGKTRLAAELFEFFRLRAVQIGEPITVDICSRQNEQNSPIEPPLVNEGTLIMQRDIKETFYAGEMAVEARRQLDAADRT